MKSIHVDDLSISNLYDNIDHDHSNLTNRQTEQNYLVVLNNNFLLCHINYILIPMYPSPQIINHYIYNHHSQVNEKNQFNEIIKLTKADFLKNPYKFLYLIKEYNDKHQYSYQKEYRLILNKNNAFLKSLINNLNENEIVNLIENLNYSLSILIYYKVFHQFIERLILKTTPKYLIKLYHYLLKSPSHTKNLLSSMKESDGFNKNHPFYVLLYKIYSQTDISFHSILSKQIFSWFSVILYDLRIFSLEVNKSILSFLIKSAKHSEFYIHTVINILKTNPNMYYILENDSIIKKIIYKFIKIFNLTQRKKEKFRFLKSNMATIQNDFLINIINNHFHVLSESQIGVNVIGYTLKIIPESISSIYEQLTNNKNIGKILKQVLNPKCKQNNIQIFKIFSCLIYYIKKYNERELYMSLIKRLFSNNKNKLSFSLIFAYLKSDLSYKFILHPLITDKSNQLNDYNEYFYKVMIKIIFNNDSSLIYKRAFILKNSIENQK